MNIVVLSIGIILLMFMIIICIISLVIRKKAMKIIDMYYDEKRENLHLKNKLGMIEYQCKNQKEGQNAYTTLRKIRSILLDEEDNKEEE